MHSKLVVLIGLLGVTTACESDVGSGANTTASGGESAAGARAGAGTGAVTGGSANSGGTATGGSSSGSTTAGGGGSATSGGAATTGGGGSTGGAVGTTDSVVFLDTPEVTHDRDYFAFQNHSPSFVPAGLSTNWLTPVDYTQWKMKMTLDVLSVPEGADANFYYTVTFTQTNADSNKGWLRPALHVVPGKTHFEHSWPVLDTQYVWNDGTEHTGSAKDDWDFSQAYASVAGDLVAWPHASYPVRVKVRIELVKN